MINYSGSRIPGITSGIIVTTKQNNVNVVDATRFLNFQGAVTVLNAGSGQANVTIGTIPDLVASAQTINATPVALFILGVANLKVGLLTVNVQARKDDGLDRAGFIRSVLFYREGLLASLSTKIHAMFTDKTNDAYNVEFQAIGTDIVIFVKGDTGNIVDWTGRLTYQLTP